MSYAVIPVEGDPDATAEAWIRDALPATFLNEVTLSTPPDVERLVHLLIARHAKCTPECDEVEEFVTRNAAFLRQYRVLDLVEEALGRRTQDRATAWAGGMIGQMRLVLDGHPEQLDLVSSRLLWLCLALDNHVMGGFLRHADVGRWLDRPATRRRMTPRAVRYLATDFYRSMNKLQSPRTGYMLIASECALAACGGLGDGDAMVMSAGLLHILPPPPDTEAWLDVRGRLRTRLIELGRWETEIEQGYQAAVARFHRHVPPDDF